MNTAVFDGIVQDLGAVSTRRGFARRLLGGAVALGAGLALGGDSLAKGKGHGKTRAEGRGTGRAAAEGKKGKKVTICYQNQTRTVKKKGYKTKFPGATLGPCTAEPQVCSSWIISGGPNPTTRIEVDDDLWIYHRAALGKQTLLIRDNDGLASSLAAVSFQAQAGEEINILAKDVNAACRSLSPLWLHCATTGQKRMLYAGNTDGCAPGRQPSYFVSQNFVISL
jgi:hypothetical protein